MPGTIVVTLTEGDTNYVFEEFVDDNDLSGHVHELEFDELERVTFPGGEP